MVRTSVFITTLDAPAAFLIGILRDEIERSVAKAAQLGFDGVDLLIGDPHTFDSRKLEKALADSDRLPPGASPGVIDFEKTINALKMVKYVSGFGAHRKCR